MEQVIRPAVFLGSEYQDIKKELQKLPRDQLIDEFAFLIYSLRKYSPHILEMLMRVGQYFRAWKRNYTHEFGILMGIVLEPAAFVIASESKHELFTKKMIIEEKAVKFVPKSSLLFWEFIPQYKEYPKEQSTQQQQSQQ